MLSGMESQMATIATFLSRRVPATEAEADSLKTIALFCAAGLFVSVLLATYGMDLSPGFF
jgi:hypothetical protein